MDRRRWLRAAGALLAVGGALPAARGTEARVIRVSARRFVFSPNEIHLRKGETAEFELVSQDVPMGFSVPDFGLRADIVPGATTKLRLTPDKAGSFVFLCDVFCGSGHENMNGQLVIA